MPAELNLRGAADLSNIRPALQLIHSDEGGGVEALAASIARGLSGHGLGLETKTLYPRPQLTRVQKLYHVALAALQLLTDRRDVLIAYQSTAALLVGVLGTLARTRVRMVHQTALPEFVPLPLRLLDRVAGTLGLYTHIVANTLATARAFDDYPAAYRRRMLVIEHGVEPLRATLTGATVRAELGIPSHGPPLLLAVGRLDDQKGHDLTLRALAATSDAHLIIVGGGPLESDYRALASELGVAERVHFIGRVARHEVGNLMGVADVFVFPSRWESFGLAVAEAAMAGVPIIAADIPVLREVLREVDGPNVRFVACGDASALGIGIRDMLNTHEARDAAKLRAPLLQHRYSEERMIETYCDILRP